MVPYRLHMPGGTSVDLESPLDFPKETRQGVEAVEEPTVDCTILVPDVHTGAVLQLCSSRRGDLLVCFHLGRLETSESKDLLNKELKMGRCFIGLSLSCSPV
jgi:translation elongation factor EF-4